MTDVDLSKELCSFIAQSPSMFHTVASIAKRLDDAGFKRISEGDAWRVGPGDCCYVVRNGSSVIAFRIGQDVTADAPFQMAASHTDSPTFKIKHVAELDGPGQMLRLNVEGYGGMLDATWFDRPLGVAGRVMVRTEDKRVESRLVASDGPVALIPNVAIHQNREANKGVAYNHQVDLCPLISVGELGQGSFDGFVAKMAGTDSEHVLGKDLYLVNLMEPHVWGWAQEFVSSPKLDDLQCAFASLSAFVETGNDSCVTVYGCFDTEEVGSRSRQGALSTFLREVLARISEALGRTNEEHLRALAHSFMVSCDNGHAVNPNHPELFDAKNQARINGGVVVKEASSGTYTTDGLGRAVFTAICQDAGVPVQTFANRSDSRGGSTLGNLSNTQVSVHSIDIGLAQLAMHSSYETAGVKDTGYLMKALQAFYAAHLQIDEDEIASCQW